MPVTAFELAKREAAASLDRYGDLPLDGGSAATSRYNRRGLFRRGSRLGLMVEVTA